MTPLDHDNQVRVQAAQEEIRAAKADAAAKEHAASDARTAAKGFPFILADGTELLAVKKLPNPQGATILVTEDGSEYVRDRTTGRYSAVTAPEAAAPAAEADTSTEEE